MAIRRPTVEKEIQKIQQQLEDAAQALADRVREELVVPACRKMDGSFNSGMGTFCFYDRRNHQIEEWTASIAIRKVLDVLNLEIYGSQLLGFWVRDVERVE